MFKKPFNFKEWTLQSVNECTDDFFYLEDILSAFSHVQYRTKSIQTETIKKYIRQLIKQGKLEILDSKEKKYKILRDE